MNKIRTLLLTIFMLLTISAPIYATEKDLNASLKEGSAQVVGEVSNMLDSIYNTQKMIISEKDIVRKMLIERKIKREEFE